MQISRPSESGSMMSRITRSGPLAAAQFERALAGLRAGDRESFLLQVVLQQREQIGVVFDQDYFLHLRPHLEGNPIWLQMHYRVTGLRMT